jgi:hypothetical protein
MTILRITDGDWITNLTNASGGWILLDAGWAPGTAEFKSGGYYSDSVMAHGQQLRHAQFDNVIEALHLKLDFETEETDQMLNQIDMLEELCMVRAPRYWTDRRCHSPVWIERQMNNETGTAYCLINQAKLSLPSDTWNTCVHSNGIMEPCLLVIDRQPFWMGAEPGQAQGDVEVSAEQAWDYNLTWQEESALPTGDVSCFLKDRSGNIWAGCESEILMWNGTAWAAVNTAPVVLGARVASTVLLPNDDILFGENGRIIKRTSGGTWSVETSDPSGVVYGMILANDGYVYAGSNKRIDKRDPDGTWSLDSSLPAGYVWCFARASNGKLFAGGENEILCQADPPTSTDLDVVLRAKTDNGEQYNATCYVPPTSQDIDLFNYNYVALRFELDIPAGAIVNSAILRCMLRGSDVSGTSLAAKIYCEDADDASALSGTDNNISNRTLTTAYETWQQTGKQRRNHWFYSPDFAHVLQEVIDRAGWATGQHAVIIVKCDDLSYSSNHAYRRQIWDWLGCNDQAPALQVTYTTGSGDTWEVNYRISENMLSMLQVSDGGLLLVGGVSNLYGTDNYGQSWGLISALPTGNTWALYEDSNGIIWCGDSGNILKSSDGGRNFSVDSTLPTTFVRGIIEDDNGDIRAGDAGRILIRDLSDRVTLGISDTTDDEAFVANKHNRANLTHVKIADGAAYTDIFPISSFPQKLLPTTWAVDDAIYFGIDTSLDDTGPFCSLVFDIATPAKASTSYTIVWEYYTGTWDMLTCLDETNQFSQVGVRSVVWKQPSDWTAIDVDGDTCSWVRARVSALDGTPTCPTQQTRDIYSAVWSCVEIDSDQCQGNIDSLVKIKLHNRSDGTSGGPGGSEPLLYANRILGGIKETAEHANFRAFLNFADKQNVDGVTVDVTVDPDSATSIEADSNLSSATGRRVFFDASTADGGNGLNNWEDRVSIELGPTVARDYYGTYKVFLRGKQNGGSAGEVNLRIKTVGGSGGVSSITEVQETQSTTDHELIEFDTPITLPVSAQMTPDELGDETSIIVQISAEQADADMYLYDIFLLPVDEMWLDATDRANSAESSVENGRHLLMDSITIPKSPTRAVVQKLEAGTNCASWVVDGDGKARLLAGKQVRLWVLAAQTSTTGATYTWHSHPEILHSVRIEKVDRWLLGRGES